MTRKKTRAYLDYGLIAIFGLFIIFPLINHYLPLLPEFSFSEKKDPAPFPPLAWDTLSRFPEEFDDFFRDHLSVRAGLVYLFNYLNVRLFNRNPLPDKVILGKNGWLFNGEPYVIRDYQNLRAFKEQELEIIARNLEQRNRWLARLGIRYYLMIPPNKHNVYPEYLPDYLQKIGTLSRLDQLKGYLEAHTSINIIDNRPVFLDLKKGAYRLYKKSDTHWSWYGAFQAYTQLAESIARDFPGLALLKISDYEIRLVEESGGDLANILGLLDEFKSPQIQLIFKGRYRSRQVTGIKGGKDDRGKNFIRRVQDDKDLPRAVVFIDSFGYYLVPFLSELFRDTLYLPNQKFNFEIILKEKPDIVIREVVERFIHILGKKPDR